jgi:hypothetical protein
MAALRLHCRLIGKDGEQGFVDYPLPSCLPNAAMIQLERG